MSSYIQGALVISHQDCSVSKKQREVYNWYEKCHSDDEVVDIYSPEWQQRITSWYNWLASTNDKQEAHVKTADGCENLDDIDFRIFFFAHPIAAFSLWHVLHACYELDEAVCGTTEKVLGKIAKWREAKPFAYLKSRGVKKMWRDKLTQLGKQIRSGHLTGEPLKLRLFAIHCGVEKLEYSVRSLDDNFGADLKDTEMGVSMLKRIREAVDDRCHMIATILRIDGNGDEDETTMSEEDAMNYDSLANSTHSIPAASQAKSLTSLHSTLRNGDNHLDAVQGSESPTLQEHYIPYSVVAAVVFHVVALSALAGVLNLWRN